MIEVSPDDKFRFGDEVFVRPQFFYDYMHSPPAIPAPVKHLVVTGRSYKCSKHKKCTESCKGVAWWVRTPADQAELEKYRAKGFRGATWNFDAHKVCTSYLLKEKKND